jgi:pimeloyl-ACP methyl ester carboxylesterase
MVIAMREQLAGVELAFADVGDAGARSALVLVHGLTSCRSEWQPFVADWARHRRVIAYDQRGHGESTHLGSPDGYTLDLLVADLGNLLDRRGVGTADLLGHSLGGVVTLRYTLTHPDRVRSLVIVNSSAFPALPTPPGVVLRLAALARTSGMAALAAIIDRISDAGRTDAAGARQFQDYFARTDVEAYQALSLAVGSFPSMLDELCTLTVPVTVLLGAEDKLIEVECRATAAAIPQAELVVIPGAAHYPQIENPKSWRQAVDTHLSRLERPNPETSMTGHRMRISNFLIEAYGRIGPLVHRAAEGLTAEQLCHQVEPAANTVAWLVWHLSRIQDQHLSELAGLPELWADTKWAQTTGVDRDPVTRGQGDGPAEVAAVRPPGPDGLLAYYDSVAGRTADYLTGVTDASLDRIVDESYTPAVSAGVRLASVLSDNLQHAGQALYLRGVIDRTWPGHG